MNKDDIYVHSDVFGSGSCIIKNKDSSDISEHFPKSILEAGQFLICHTKAWKSSVPDKAYWVRPSQVSKTPETGEYLTKGSFMIRGQKNIINVDRLELGFGILYKIIGNDDFVEYADKDIEYAIPVMGTYTSMLKYKFKVKVIPGTQKIKKVLADVMSLFNKKAHFLEKSAIKKISNDSIQRVLVTGVKFFI